MASPAATVSRNESPDHVIAKVARVAVLDADDETLAVGQAALVGLRRLGYGHLACLVDVFIGGAMVGVGPLDDAQAYVSNRVGRFCAEGSADVPQLDASCSGGSPWRPGLATVTSKHRTPELGSSGRTSPTSSAGVPVRAMPSGDGAQSSSLPARASLRGQRLVGLSAVRRRTRCQVGRPRRRCDSHHGHGAPRWIELPG